MQSLNQKKLARNRVEGKGILSFCSLLSPLPVTLTSALLDPRGPCASLGKSTLGVISGEATF
jgi:hypothetical protein